SDLDGDGCPDLYVANDFQEDDFLYYNNCDGTFTEAIATSVGHTSHASMGVDAADLNNDGRPDLMVLDMLPDQEKILKTSANAESFDVYLQKLETGYHPQYARNTLQLNRGERRFSEIGYLAGVYATDWSWAPLFADLDNDGYKDLFITSGIYHRPNDLDYLTYVADPVIQASLKEGTGGLVRALIRKMPQVPIPNYAYHNNGDLTFTNMARAWGLGQPGFSNGAAYVDLNNSGALDLVVSKIDAPAAIYRNRARALTGNHYLQVVLKGSGANTTGIGAKVVIREGGKGGTGGKVQMLEQFPTRGFQSSVDPRLHFGLGSAEQIDSLTWTATAVTTSTSEAPSGRPAGSSSSGATARSATARSARSRSTALVRTSTRCSSTPTSTGVPISTSSAGAASSRRTTPTSTTGCSG